MGEGASTEHLLRTAGRALLNWSENSDGINACFLLLSVALVLGSGFFSGLTLGLLSLDHLDMCARRNSWARTGRGEAVAWGGRSRLATHAL